MKKSLATIGLACLFLAASAPLMGGGGAAWAQQAPAVEEIPANVQLPIDNRFRATPGASDYPGAPALLVQDVINFSAASDGSTSFEEHDVIKLFTAEGIEDHRNFVRVYQKDIESVEIKEARTILPDGRVLEIPKQAIIDEPLLPESKLYRNYRRLIIRYPAVRKDCLVEFHVLTHRNAVPEHRWWNVTYVQNPEPMLSSTYNVTVPAGTELHWAAPGLDHAEPARARVGTNDQYFWHVENLKPYRSEPSGPPLLTQMARIEVTNFATWDGLRNWFDQLWDGATVVSGPVRAKATEICADAKDDAAKLNAIVRYMGRKNTAQLQAEDLLPHKASEMVDEKELTPLDSCVLAAALMRAEGLQATPVMAFEEPSYVVRPALPRVGRVDQVLLRVSLKGKTVWLDPEHLSAVLDAPPAGFQGMAALTREGFANLPDYDPDANRREARVEARVDEEGKAEVLLELKEYGDAAAIYRDAGRELANRSLDNREVMLDNIFEHVARAFSSRARVHDRYFPLSTDADKPFELAATLSVSGFANNASGLVKVPLPVEPSERLAGLLSDHEPRQSPVRFASPVREEIRMHLLLPPGCQVMEVPPTVEVKTAFGSFYATARSSGSEVWYYSRLVLLPTWVKPDQVAPLMEFARKVVGSQTAGVVYTPPAQASGSRI